MIKILISALLIMQASFYSLSFKTIDDDSVAMGSFKGKKVLVVNIATSNKNVDQVKDLARLQQQFLDKLIIIAFPSNSFGHEQRTNLEIKKFLKSNSDINFLIAEKNAIAGSGIQPVYKWLTDQNENGMMHGEVAGDFQKFLVDENGRLVGVFAPGVKPLDSLIINAISTNYQ